EVSVPDLPRIAALLESASHHEERAIPADRIGAENLRAQVGEKQGALASHAGIRVEAKVGQTILFHARAQEDRATGCHLAAVGIERPLQRGDSYALKGSGELAQVEYETVAVELLERDLVDRA